MRIPDRLSPPDVSCISTVPVIKPEVVTFPNNVVALFINTGTQDVCKIEIVFPEAYPDCNTNILAHSFASAMIKEGTPEKSSAAIADEFDFFGAYTEFNSEKDLSSASLYTRNDVALKTIPLFAEILFNANFPENEFVKLVERKKQKFLVNYEKLSYQARLRFSKLLFGKSNPYGLTIDEEAFQKITREEAYQFYKEKYLNGNFFLVVAGKISDEIVKSVSKNFGEKIIPESSKTGSALFSVKQENTGRHFIPKEDALQSAIRMGMLMPNKKHEDYNNLKVLNTVLGGYFGSRLMANIREEKGYTYGIGSSLISLRNTGFFIISSEIRADVTSKAIDEIYKEIKILQNELVSSGELETVKNYMIGNLLRGLDGPFALADVTKSLYMDGLSYDFVQFYADDIRKINSEQIKSLAKKYFAHEFFLELVIGRI